MKLSTIIWSTLKLALAAGLVAWMIESGRLDFASLQIVAQKPHLILLVIMQWVCMTVLIGGVRWYVLLRGLGLPVELGRTLKLHLTGLFFNTVMPGAVGGDIIKGAYVIRDQSSRKTPAMMTVILDRVVGLMGLFLVGSVGVLISFDKFWQNSLLRPLLLMILGVLVFTVFVYSIGLMPLADQRDPILKFFAWKPLPGLSIPEKIYRAFRSYRHKPSALLGALGLSILIQAVSMAYFMYLTTAVTGQHVPFAEFASIYPIGALMTALPLAPGGLGVGHAAFENLYKLIGLTDGANIFNIYFLGTMSLNLLGAIPYLFLTGNGTKPMSKASLESEAYVDTAL